MCEGEWQTDGGEGTRKNKNADKGGWKEFDTRETQSSGSGAVIFQTIFLSTLSTDSTVDNTTSRPPFLPSCLSVLLTV